MLEDPNTTGFIKGKEDFDYKESLLPPEEQAEFNDLGSKLTSKELTAEERKRYLELSAKAEQVKKERYQK